MQRYEKELRIYIHYQEIMTIMRDIVFDLDKNLTLSKENILSFPSLHRFFALSFDKIGTR